MSDNAHSRTTDCMVHDPLSQRIADLEAQLAAREQQLAEREQELASYRHAKERFHMALDSMLDPCVIVSSVRDAADNIVDFRVEYANELACRMGGKSQADVIGRTLRELNPEHDGAKLFSEYCRVVETGRPLVLTNQVHEEERDGINLHVHFDLQVVKQEDGFVATWRDVTAHAHALADLQKSQERLRLALEANHMGFWEWEIEGMSLCSRELCSIFGLPCEDDFQIVSPATLVRTIYPADYPEVRRLLLKSVDTGCDFHHVFRVVHPGGVIRWVESMGHVLRNRTGTPTNLIGVVMDITERKQLSDELEEAMGLLNGLFESAPVGLAVWDADLRFQRINSALAAMNGLPQEEHLGHTVSDLLPDLENVAEIDAQRRKVLETGVPLLNYEVAGSTPASDEPHIWREHFYPIRRQDEVIGVGAIVEDITILKRAAGERERLVQELAAERARLADLTEHLEEIVAERTQQVRHLANQVTVAEQEERARISQILHDHIQQMLYGIQMRTHLIASDLHTAQLDPADAALLHNNLDDLNRLAQDAITVARNLAIELNPPVLDTDDLNSLLHWLAGHMQELHGLQTRLALPTGEPLQLADKNRRLLLLHSVRELLFNVVKHAGTRTADMEVFHQGGVLHVTVSDHGAGFDLDQIEVKTDKPSTGKKSSLGLSTLSERLRLFEGTLCVRSAPGVGSSITIMLPDNQA